MFARVRGEVLAVLLLTVMLILKLLFFLSDENEAIEIDLGEIEG